MAWVRTAEELIAQTKLNKDDYFYEFVDRLLHLGEPIKQRDVGKTIDQAEQLYRYGAAALYLKANQNNDIPDEDFEAAVRAANTLYQTASRELDWDMIEQTWWRIWLRYIRANRSTVQRELDAYMNRDKPQKPSGDSEPSAKTDTAATGDKAPMSAPPPAPPRRWWMRAQKAGSRRARKGRPTRRKRRRQ